MRKTTAKAMAALLALVMLLSLAGCGHEHTWADATCTAPKTCTECGKTEGEALGHNWQDATCSAPKTCSLCKETEGEALPHTWEEATCAAPKTCTVCGETEGEALPHTLTEANYQSPATCTVCGAEVGDVLTPAFESSETDTSGFQPAELGITYEYHGVAYDDHSVQQTNHVTFENYRVIASDDTHEAKEGYEWNIAQIHFLCDDPTVQTRGWTAFFYAVDYYTGIRMVSTEHDVTFTVNYNGTDYECLGTVAVVENNWINDNTAVDCVIEVSIQVPAGYDGIVALAPNVFSVEEYDFFYETDEENLVDFSGRVLQYIRLGA